jgi:hypothetical protein
MRHPSAPLLSAALAAAALAGCDQPFLSARVEIPEIRIVEPAQEFPAAASVDPSHACSLLQATTGRSCAAVTVGYDIGGEVPGFEERGVTVDLRLTDLALHLTAGGVSDLRGVTRAEVDLRDPGTGAVTRIASYVRPPGSTPTSIAVGGASNVDLSPYLQSGKLDAHVEVEMDPVFLPSGFTAAIEAAFSAVVTVDYRSL